MLLGACTAICLVDAHTLGITIRCVRLNIHYSIVKDLLPNLARREDAQNSTLNVNEVSAVLSAQLRAAQSANRFAQVGVSCTRPAPGCTGREGKFPADLRPQESFGGGEGVRTPDLRLAKPALCQLSYAPSVGLRKRLVAGAGFEPATFGL